MVDLRFHCPVSIGRELPSTEVTRRQKPEGGFTLVEVALVMGLLALLVVLFGISLNQATANRELDSAASTLYGTIAYARDLAVSRGGATVTFASSINGPTWQVAAGGRVLGSGQLPRTVSLVAPVNPLAFSANGSVAVATALSLASLVTKRSAQLVLTQRTGAVALTVVN